MELLLVLFIVACLVLIVVGDIQAKRSLNKFSNDALKEIQQIGVKTTNIEPEPDVVVTVDAEGNVWHSHIVDHVPPGSVQPTLNSPPFKTTKGPPGIQVPKPKRPPTEKRTMWD